MAKQYNCLPSELLGIEDIYTAFCFNEACSVIISHLINGEKPNYSIANKNKVKNNSYKKPSDLYKDMELYGGDMNGSEYR